MCNSPWSTEPTSNESSIDDLVEMVRPVTDAFAEKAVYSSPRRVQSDECSPTLLDTYRVEAVMSDEHKGLFEHLERFCQSYQLFRAGKSESGMFVVQSAMHPGFRRNAMYQQWQILSQEIRNYQSPTPGQDFESLGAYRHNL